ncbi:uncharacterized protein [Macrobrachium rosenbergii]|uniref:uncharacterized protein n=1 Tax=Macrobrachium rosenbergii TaxID=79674 RepID=UPI0034D4FE63
MYAERGVYKTRASRRVHYNRLCLPAASTTGLLLYTFSSCNNQIPSSMTWLKSAILLLGIGGAHLQCFTPDANIPPLDKNADLSGVADFGFTLYKQLTLEKPSENFFFSPYSIWAALVMVYFGAAGNTQAQLGEGLRLRDKPSAHRLSKGLEILYKQQSNANISLDVANRVYVHEALALLPCVHTVFPDELRVLNFLDATNAAGTMNAFVNKTTRGLISNIVTEDIVRTASMILINAVYFKGFWKQEFKKSNTQKKDFFVAPSNKISVDMMSQVSDFKYGESRQLGARVLELPYAGSNLAMILLLPNSNGNGGSSLANVVKGLSSTALREAISPGKLQLHRVDLRLPKFKFRAELADDLVKALKTMGIVDMFDENLADLSQFSSKDKLAVSDIIHKAYVDVNEEGTEAAAATAVVISITSIAAPPPIVQFHCDRPFVFMIYDRLTNNVLFMGDIKNPANFQSYSCNIQIPRSMIWLKSAILLLGIGGAHLQCFTPDANVPPLDKNADLSGVADFGFTLYKQLTLEKPSENFFFSPYSIWAALVMVYFGAAGNTQAQLAAGLRLKDKPSAHRLSKGLEILYEQQNNANVSLDVANRVYVNDSLALLPCVQTVFPDELRVLNFLDAKNAAGAMNAFVNKTTRGLISSIVEEDIVYTASMILINAVYFKGFWKQEFKKSNTNKKDFFVAPSNKISVDMMSQISDFNYGESRELGARVLELPYAESNLSMILLLPNSNGNGGSSLASVVKGLSSTALREAISPGKLQSHRVDLLLPKFKFRAKLADNLVEALKTMGIVDMFDENLADLSQFSSKNKLAVSDIIHKAYVDVNEEGTEATAATAVVISIISAAPPPPIVQFHCDRPFVFMIYDRLTNNVLFMGDIKNPANFQS